MRKKIPHFLHNSTMKKQESSYLIHATNITK